MCVLAHVWVYHSLSINGYIFDAQLRSEARISYRPILSLYSCAPVFDHNHCTHVICYSALLLWVTNLTSQIPDVVLFLS